MLERYNSKKFVVVMTMILLTFVMAMTEKLTPVVGSIFAAIGIMYPAAQSYVDGKKNGHT